jgi:hypothetical protein
MTLSAAVASTPVHCDEADSVLAAIEARWTEHNAKKPGLVLGLYAALAHVLNDEGVIVDTVDGLGILEHCRRRNLPIVNILFAIEKRVRDAGYRGERLGLADFYAAGGLIYAFYDASRFKTFEALKLKVHQRVALTDIALGQPEA